MAGTDKKINVALLAMPEVTASSLYGMYDVFSSAGRDWLYITKGVAGEPRMHPYVVSNQTPQFLAANNVWIRPDHGLEDCPRRQSSASRTSSLFRAKAAPDASRQKSRGCVNAMLLERP